MQYWLHYIGHKEFKEFLSISTWKPLWKKIFSSAICFKPKISAFFTLFWVGNTNNLMAKMQLWLHYIGHRGIPKRNAWRVLENFMPLESGLGNPFWKRHLISYLQQKKYRAKTKVIHSKYYKHRLYTKIWKTLKSMIL